jgi:cation:H+ antiporter
MLGIGSNRGFAKRLFRRMSVGDRVVRRQQNNRKAPLSINGLTLFIVGLAILTAGAELVVRGASRLAASLGVKPIIVGLTVVAIGTSMPELAVGIIASHQGSGSLVVGNIAGTNVFNILFILGLSALLQPLPIDLRIIRLDLPAMIAAATMMTVMAWDGVLTRFDGGVMLGAAVIYTLVLIRDIRRERRTVKAEFRDMYGIDNKHGWVAVRIRAKCTVMLAIGIGLTVLGADWLVKGATDIARAFGIPEGIIGLSIVAIGTSAPELATTVIATIRNERDIAVGNLLGSSIYNILAILGLTCLISSVKLHVERQLMLVDIPLMFGVALLCVPAFLTGKRVSRLEGGIFVASYVIYMLSLIFFRN